MLQVCNSTRENAAITGEWVIFEASRDCEQISPCISWYQNPKNLAGNYPGQFQRVYDESNKKMMRPTRIQKDHRIWWCL